MTPTLRYSRFENDCAHCASLGSWEPPRAEDIELKYFDLYYCPKMGWPTLISRYGDKPGDMTSATPETIEAATLPDLVEAKRRAIECGLLERRKAPF